MAEMVYILKQKNTHCSVCVIVCVCVCVHACV